MILGPFQDRIFYDSVIYMNNLNFFNHHICFVRFCQGLVEINQDDVLQYKNLNCIGPLSASHHISLNFSFSLPGPAALICYFIIFYYFVF